ncbi:response regulator [Chryseolinea sp. H1M3-3]|uniref:response regulator n=1 Tax=Chryseolinea sp. H1M3-3 TaxID=3034144 RepID=UPI0023EB5F84|nr:response regulator [Chryseolinea sp. H1M3-3]
MIPVHILLADDDRDDRYFFDKAVESLSIPTRLTMVDDGAKLMAYLFENSAKLPDVLFLDYNMPRKNGFECLTEIKSSPELKALPVIMYSTYVHDDVADMLYASGAHYYIRKTGIDELAKLIQFVLTRIIKNKFDRPARKKFILSLLEV